MFSKMQNFSRAQQCLGRYATPVKANTTQMLAFNNGCLQPKLGGTYRRYISAGARPDDDDIISIGHA